MFRNEYRKDIEAVGPTEEQLARLTAMLAEQEETPMKTRKFTFKPVLIAATLAAVMLVSALAVELTVGWESFLGRTPPEGAATDVGVSAVTGDYTLTLRESIVDDDGAAFLLALTRNDGQVLAGDPALSFWDVEVDGEFPNMSMGVQPSIRSEDGKTVYYCVEFEAEGEEWDKDSVLGKTITFQCDGVVDKEWTEEELALTTEKVSLAPLAQTARQVDLRYDDICAGEGDEELLPLVKELSAQASVPLTRPGEGKSRVSAVLFSEDGLMVAVDDWNGAVQQGQYRIGQGAALVLTDTRTGEKWNCSGYVKRGGETGFYLSAFLDCPLTQEDLPYVDVTVSYQMDKVLSDQPVELPFTASEGLQTTETLDQDITFNYLGDFSAHLTGARISALRVRLAFDRGERAGWDWENRADTSSWAVRYKDGSQVPLGLPTIKDEELDGTGWIGLEGRDENSNRLLIDPAQVEAILVGETVIPLT